jgi:hypothetical protein
MFHINCDLRLCSRGDCWGAVTGTYQRPFFCSKLLLLFTVLLYVDIHVTYLSPRNGVKLKLP